MAHFMQPTGTSYQGYDADNKLAPGSLWRVRIPQGSTYRIGLWGGAGLKLKSTNSKVVPNDRLKEVSPSDDLRVFEVFGDHEGESNIEARGEDDAFWIRLQILVTPRVIDKTKRIVVDLNWQNLTAYQDRDVVLFVDCVSGDKDHATPTGHFTVIRKVNPCFSTEYKAQMDHALFFTNRGHAIHQSYGSTLSSFGAGVSSFFKSCGIDSLGSHGCVRLSEGNATWLYDWADVGTPIWIH